MLVAALMRTSVTSDWCPSSNFSKSSTVNMSLLRAKNRKQIRLAMASDHSDVSFANLFCI